MRVQRIFRTSRPRRSSSSLPLLWAGLSACAFDPPAGEGLLLETRAPDYDFASSPSTTVDAGSASEDASSAPSEQACKHVSAFTEHVTPVFSSTCTECHDGTKIKAVFRLNLIDVEDLSPAAQQATCDFTLATADRGAPEESTIFTFLDPENSATVHDFKFESVEEFVAYREAVLTWLRLEVDTQQ
jgi:hypothetical protein